MTPDKKKKSTNKKDIGRLPERLSRPRNFQTKLLMSMIRIALPVIGIICVGSFLMLSGSARISASNSQATAMGKVTNDLYYITENTENLSRDMIFNTEIQELLEENARGELYPDTSSVAYYINSFIANRDFIDCVVLTGLDQTLYSTERAYTDLSDFNIIRQKWWFPKLKSHENAFDWFTGATSSVPGDPGTSGTDPAAAAGLMLARSIYSIEDYSTHLGYLMIYIDDDYLNEIWEGCQFGNTTNIWILDDSGNVLMDNHPSRDYSFLLQAIDSDNMGNQVIRSRGRQYIVGSQSFPDSSWTVCIATPYREVNSRVYVLLGEFVLLAISIVLLLVFFLRRSTATISEPIIRLSQIMDTFHGSDRPAREYARDQLRYEDRTDEVGQIYRSYDQMVSRMDTLIREIYIKTLEKKDAELALLQSQINPHFLYNTLDSINWMALANDQEEISEMVTALSDMFRLSLTKSSSPYVPLSREIEYIKSYLVLQKFRYEERLQYDFRISVPKEDLFIPKFILQPIVENALKHGIDTLEEGGEVQIEAFADTDDLVIRVINDGTDIDLEQMEKLLFFDPDHMEYLAFSKNGYGVQNIHRRIRILCGIRFGLTYQTEDSRTICQIRLPVKTTDIQEREISSEKD